MVSDSAVTESPSGLGKSAACWLALVLVVVGMLNSMPGIPGLDDLVKSATGTHWLIIRKFPYEYLYPLIFSLMMLIVALDQSAWREWQDRSPGWRYAGLAIDILLVLMAVVISVSYANEIQAVCLTDQITGDRARLVAQSLHAAQESAKLFGLPIPSTADDPKCLNSLGGFLVPIMTVAVIVFLGYTTRLWGLPLVLVALFFVSYTIATVAVWYYFGTAGFNKYLVTKLGSDPRTLADAYPRFLDLLTSNGSGLLGRYLDITLSDVFPYLILGTLFGTSAGGQALIKLAFRLTRRLRGGPAHAAVISSAMFGTISGGPVVNVLSTGVLTIPMMLKRGFSRTFAGGIEAAASSGGSIMPPVMGVAAFILAAITSVPYSQVIIAAIIPAVAYYFCLFLAVVFQSRKQNIQAVGDLTEDMRFYRQDYLNLVMILGPILLILFLLLTTKEMVGCSALSGWLGAEQTFSNGACRASNLPWLLQLIQNAAGDVGSAGWWAVVLLLGLLFLDPEVRAKPRKLIDALSGAGLIISSLYLMFLAVSIIEVCLKLTGLPFHISLDALQWLQSLNLGAGGPFLFQLMALIVTMALAIVLGMGMPAAPAFLNVALLLAPVLAGLGISVFTAHMFIFYFAVASAITPPVAVAAFAAATIAKAEPTAIGFSAVRSGIVMFAIPFVFAFYPELLLIRDAVVDPTSVANAVKYLPGYDGTIHWGALGLLLARMVLALYLLASALARFDRVRLPMWDVSLRLVLAAAAMAQVPAIYGPACALGLAWIYLHIWRDRAIGVPA